MENAASLDVILLANSLFIIGFYESLTAVALTEGYLVGEGPDVDGQGLVRLEEGVPREVRDIF